MVKAGMGAPRRLEAPLGTELGSTLEAARRVGIRALAPHLPESSAELSEAWRDALLGLSWLLPDGSEEGAALEAYLLLGESLELPPEAPATASRPDAPDPRAGEAAKALRETGLFDEAWYRERYPDVISSGADPLLHYCEFGWIEDRDPSASFSSSSYLAANPDVVASGMNPLWHYAAFGREERRAMAPAGPAKVAAATVPTDPRTVASIDELFDRQFYLDSNPDVREGGNDPLIHYLEAGHLEGRDPSPDFHTDYYRAKYLGTVPELNPLVHYVQVGAAHGHLTRPGSHDLETDLAAQVRFSVNPGPEFEEVEESIGTGLDARAKAIAFYLPQFHPIPENDEWWGKGFTEWRNVARGRRVRGPLPAAISRASSASTTSPPGVTRRRSSWRATHGLHGFCFYYYWFDGAGCSSARSSSSWPTGASTSRSASAGRTRTGPGAGTATNDEILIAQETTPPTTTALHRRPRSRCCATRATSASTAGRCSSCTAPTSCRTRGDVRALARASGGTRHRREPLIFAGADVRGRRTRASSASTPRSSFRRTSWRGRTADQRTTTASSTRPSAVTSSTTGRWPSSLASPGRTIRCYDGVLPSWDNEARRPGRRPIVRRARRRSATRSGCALRSSGDASIPSPARRWCSSTRGTSGRKAAYLEPDVHHGGAYLNATARAIYGARKGAKPRSGAESPAATGRTSAAATAREKRKILLVGHDAHPFGSQHLLRHIGDTLANQFGCEVAYLLRSDAGEMTDRYEEIGEVLVTDDDPPAPTLCSQSSAPAAFTPRSPTQRRPAASRPTLSRRPSGSSRSSTSCRGWWRSTGFKSL